MMKFLRLAAMLLLAAVIMPLSANAQEPKKEEPAKAARARAARPAPAARPAQPAARPAPPPAARALAPRPAPAARAPAGRRAPAARVVRQRQAPQRAAAPQRATAPRRHAAPRTVNPQANAPARAATPAARNAARSAAPAATAAPTRAQLRSQQRQERTLRQQETRQLRTLPAAQRAQKQQEINQQRQQRAQQRLQPNVQTQPNALVQPNAQAQRGLRRNGVARVTPQAAQQGRFAARFAARAQGVQGANARVGTAAVAPRRAWSRGLRAAFVPWYGPVFWPYAYSDVFDYAFWPSGYDDGYWAYAYDDFFDGVFWGEAGPPPDYGYALASPNAPAAHPSYAAVQELCTQPGTGITAWPFAEINSKVGLNADQKQLLDQVRSSGQKAATVFKTSCPAGNAFPMTPPGRLQAITLRLGATLEAVQTVRPAMETFYDSLSDEQKERFNEIGPKQPKDNAAASQASAQDAKSCSEPKPGLTNLPIERIEDAVKPTDAQEAGLKQLEDATAKAVSTMQAACPEDTPITPPGRLEAMEKRLRAMIDAANTVKPALNDFYASLSSEQKARFNRIGRELAQSGN